MDPGGSVSRRSFVQGAGALAAAAVLPLNQAHALDAAPAVVTAAAECVRSGEIGAISHAYLRVQPNGKVTFADLLASYFRIVARPAPKRVTALGERSVQLANVAMSDGSVVMAAYLDSVSRGSTSIVLCGDRGTLRIESDRILARNADSRGRRFRTIYTSIGDRRGFRLHDDDPCVAAAARVMALAQRSVDEARPVRFSAA